MAVRAERLAATAIETGERETMVDAAYAYYEALGDTPVAQTQARAELDNNLGALLCLLAQTGKTLEDILPVLEEAQIHLTAALKARSKTDTPHLWAITQANLALVFITRFGHTGDKIQVVEGRSALIHAAEVFEGNQDRQWIDWIQAIRDHLLWLELED